MEDEKREIRNVSAPLTRAADPESRMVEGYALLFRTPSDRLDFEETIDEGALDGVIERSDVFCVIDHDINRGVLGRCKRGEGSLSLTIDEKGLMYRFEAPKTALGDELLENLRRGEIDESSFCFDVEDEEWIKKEDGSWKRSIKQIGNLYDVSPVYRAAYSSTSVYLRGLELAKEKEAEEARKAAEMPASYFENLTKTFNI